MWKNRVATYKQLQWLTSKPVGSEVHNTMHMYYAFGNHIYSLSSMNTHVLFL